MKDHEKETNAKGLDETICSLCRGKEFVEDETPWGIMESPCPDCQRGGVCSGCGGYDPELPEEGFCDVCVEAVIDYQAEYYRQFHQANAQILLPLP